MRWQQTAARKRALRHYVSGLVMALALTGGMSVMSTAVAQNYAISDEDDAAPADPNAPAAIVWDKKRLDRLDRNVRKLERAVQKTENKAAPPILVEPDPEVVALQATVDFLSRKLDEQAAVLTRLTGQLEEANFAATQAQSQVQALTARTDTLTKRVDLLDAKSKDMEAALAGPPPPPPTTGSAETDFDQAYSLMSSNQLDEATTAFEAFTTQWPKSAQVAEAWFRLGQIRTMRGDISGSVAAYATSLKGWPKASWAPESTVKLATALADLNRKVETCAALTEFDKRYAAQASAPMKSQAKALKGKAQCAA